MMTGRFFEVKKILIYSIYVFVVKGSINFTVTSGTDQCPGSSINISCVVVQQTSAVTIAKPNGSIVVSCTAPLGGTETICSPVGPYVIVANNVGNTTTFVLTILSLNKSKHNGIWKCIDGIFGNETMISVIAPVSAPGRSPKISVFPQSGGIVSNATIKGHVFCLNSILSSELLYGNKDGVYTVLKPQPPWFISDAGNNGCDRGENNKIYTTTVTRTMSALKGKTVTFKIRFNQTQCGSSFTTDSSPVFFFPDPPISNHTIIKGIDNSLLVEAGEIVNLQCEVIGGVPLAHITWNCFGGTVTNTSVAGIARSNITFTTTGDKNGQFCICSATHPVADIMDTSVQVYVTYGPRTVTFKPSTTNYSPTELSTIPDITCSADCKPNCNYTWTKNGQVTSHGSGSTLSLRNVNRYDTGVYRCTSWNVHDKINSSDINVDVEFKPTQLNSISKVFLFDLYKSAEIKLIYLANPNPEFTWFHDDGYGNYIKQESGSNNVLTNNSQDNAFTHSSQLTIINLQKEDLGNYRILISSPFGVRFDEIIVAEKGVPYPPRDVKVFCETANTALLIWTSALNGGKEQKFSIKYWVKEDLKTEISFPKKDPGYGKQIHHSIRQLQSETNYTFVVVAINAYGETISTRVSCFAQDLNDNSNNYMPINVALIIGPVLGSITITVLITLSVIGLVRRKMEKNQKTNNREQGEQYQDLDIVDNTNAYAMIEQQGTYENQMNGNETNTLQY